MISRLEEEHEVFQRINVSSIEKLQYPIMPKTILKNIDKCTDYIMKFSTGFSNFNALNEVENSSEIDDWGVQFLSVLFEGRSIKHFNTGMFLETLKAQQTVEIYDVIKMRWQAIEEYFLGNVEECIEKLKRILEYARKISLPTWMIKDILIDLRNQQSVLNTINNQISEPDAQKELINSNEELYYPIIDRISDSLNEKYIEALFKEKIKSPFSVTYSNELWKYSGMLASIFITAMYNG